MPLFVTALTLSLQAPLAPVASASSPTAAVQEVAPYVQNVTSTSAVLMWRTAEPRASVVKVSGREVRLSAPTTHHQVALSGLKPNSVISYEVPGFGSGSFRTAPQGNGKTRFIVVGDTGSGNANQRAVAAQMREYRPDFVLHVGDVVYDDGEERLYPQRFFTPFQAIIANAPLYPVIGNHDVKAEKGAAYLRAFDLPSEESGTERYYSFRWGQAEFFALDTTDRDFLKPGSPQVEWLEKALSRSTATWKIAFGHHPIYSNGADGGKPFLRSRALPLFKRYGLDLYINGHEHNYERFLAPEDGVHFVVTGGGGAWLRPGKQKNQDQEKPSIYRDVYHFVGAEMDGDRLTLTAIDKDGKAFDAVTLKR
ncbi:Alkaline phosphatase precursor [compost metagenome]